MSRSEATAQFNRSADELIGAVNEMVDSGRSVDVDAERLGQLFAAVVRVYADKVQSGEDVRPYGRNANLVITDVAIACTALMSAVQLEVFELGGWQMMSGLGRVKNADETVLSGS